MCLGAIYWAHLDRIYYGATREEAAAAGFADDFIYKELDKKMEDRSVRIDQILHAEAQEPFRLWDEKEDRTDY